MTSNLDPAVQAYMAELENQVQQERLRSATLQKDYGQVSMFASSDNSNLIQWQLDLREELEKIDHLLRGHVIKRDNNGNEVWADPTRKVLCTIVRDDLGIKYYIRELEFIDAPNMTEKIKNAVFKIVQLDGQTIDIEGEVGVKLYNDLRESTDLEVIEYKVMDVVDEDLKPFNEYGVQLLINIISFYLNRNTILSNYDEEMINTKMKDLGIDLTDLIMLKYEEMGMTTRAKRKLYFIVVRQIVDTIHSAYLRALNGGERDSLRTARHVTQSDNQLMRQGMGGNVSMPSSSGSSKFSLFKPSTWGKA